MSAFPARIQIGPIRRIRPIFPNGESQVVRHARSVPLFEQKGAKPGVIIGVD